MKRIYALLISALLLALFCCSCAANAPDPTDIQPEPTVLITEPVMTVSAATEPPVQVVPTDPPQPEKAR